MSQLIEIQTTKTDILDIAKEKIHFNITIKDILTKFRTKVLPENPSNFIIEDNIKIRDLLGWSTLKEIRLVTKKTHPLLVSINDKKIITCTSILMPVYDINQMNQFRGPITNRFSTKHFNELVKDDLFVLVNYNEKKIVYLSKVKSIFPYSKKTAKTFKSFVRNEKMYFAQLVTSTGTATLNNFHWLTNLKEK